MDDQQPTPDIPSVDVSFSSFVEHLDRMAKRPNTVRQPLEQLPLKYRVKKDGIPPCNCRPPLLHFGIGVTCKQIVDYATSRLNHPVPAVSSRVAIVYVASIKVSMHLSRLTGVKVETQVAAGGPYCYLYSLYSNHEEWKKPSEELERKALDIIRRELGTEEQGLWYYSPRS